VLLADGWYEVETGSFETDGHSFGFTRTTHVGNGGNVEERYVTGPLISVVAVESAIPPHPNSPAPPPPSWP
jgi:hypothetical protein